MAYECLGLLPFQFWMLTPAEFDKMMQGYSRREEREWERTAWLAAHIVNMSGKMTKKDVTIDILLGRKPRKKKGSQWDWESLKAQFGIEEVNRDGSSGRYQSQTGS